ncbi:unnamed protein product [Owenia fusiformis]|uniref:Sepiapterin reductase n=1 Tax=Owenia fusiformis TaxID=6347 RepID=A0A8J1XSW0_OWEFU|nr:unnamed protein product [Owenia fusiformis]
MAEVGKIFNRRTFCLITGASRGLGHHIGKGFAEKFVDHSMIVLVSRDEEGLAQTKQKIKQSNTKIDVLICPQDLSSDNEQDYDNLFQKIITSNVFLSTKFEQAMIVHNAGSMGDVSKRVIDFKDPKHIQRYFNINVGSMLVLNSKFLDLFAADKVKHRVCIQLSSLCAIQAFKSWSLYCSGKAARDMLWSTLAEECPDIRVLSYAPGPLDTEMQVVARTDSADPDVKNMFIKMHAEKQLVEPSSSVERLIKILEKDAFKNGQHVDFYDDL